MMHMNRQQKLAYVEWRWPCALCLLRLHMPMREIVARLRLSKEHLLFLNKHRKVGRTLADARRLLAKRMRANLRQDIVRKPKPTREEINARYKAIPLEIRSARAKAYYYANREKIIAQKSKRHSFQLRNDPSERLVRHIRNTVLRMAALGGQRQHRSSIYLGCSYEQCRRYITGLLKPGMSWDNYGDIWELDHIHPLSSFNLTIDAEALRAAHYTNLRPMFVTDNRSKHSKLITARQMELV